MTPEREVRRNAALALALLFAAYGWVVFSHAGRSVGGSDSSGYYNLARAIASGRVVEPVPPFGASTRPEEIHLFLPLGYVPGPSPGTMSPFYPVGLPLHFVAAAAVAGWALGPFLVSPLAAVGCLLLIFLAGRELGLSLLGGIAAAAMFAIVPVFTFFAVQPMSDVVATFWALAAILAALVSRRRPAAALAAGMAFGIGVLVRPSSAVLIVPLLFALPPRPKAWVFFLVGGVPCAAVLLAFNRAAYGGVLRTGYQIGGATTDFAWANFPVRFRHYGYWTAAMMSPIPLAGWLWFCAAGRGRSEGKERECLPGRTDRAAGGQDRLPWGRDPDRVRARLLLASWFAVVFLFYCFYGPYEAWWYTRYVLPGIPALTIAAALAAEDVLERVRRSGTRSHRNVFRKAVSARAVRAGLSFAFLLVLLAGYRVGRRYRVLDIGRTESVYPETVRWASGLVPPKGLVAVMQFSGAMKTYGGPAFFRWDWMEAPRFPDFRRRMEAAGYTLYGLVNKYEARDAAPRMPGNWKLVATRGDVTLWKLEQ